MFGDRRKRFNKVYKCNCEDICPRYKKCSHCDGLLVTNIKACPTKQQVSSDEPTDKEWDQIKQPQYYLLHSTRHNPHLFKIYDEETGTLDEYLEHILFVFLAETLQVHKNTQKKKGRKLQSDEPYLVDCKCPKDRDISVVKQCTRRIGVKPIINGLTLAIEQMPDGAPKTKLINFRNRFREEIMEAILRFDRERVRSGIENGDSNVYAEYTRCPRAGCTYCNGFRCNPEERKLQNGRINNIVYCPDLNCQQEGEHTWWCSLCDLKHLGKCKPPDPRKKMTKEELQFHDEQVSLGLEQVCSCGFYYSKTNGTCDHVTCKLCKRQFCFGCGAKIDGRNYMTVHLSYGPRENEIGDGWGCRRMFAIKASSNTVTPEYRERVREFLEDSLENADRSKNNFYSAISSESLMLEAEFVLNNPMHQLEGEGRDWLLNLVIQANLKGIYRGIIRKATSLITNQQSEEYKYRRYLRSHLEESLHSPILMELAREELNKSNTNFKDDEKQWLEDLVNKAGLKKTLI
jgi:hypothetical protein